MKLFKKMVAVVAVAACCFTMTAPVKAEAAAPKFQEVAMCSHECTEKTYVDFEMFSDRHPYTYTTDKNENNVPETVYAECLYVVVDEFYEVSCFCGQVSGGIVVERTVIHFDCDE